MHKSVRAAVSTLAFLTIQPLSAQMELPPVLGPADVMQYARGIIEAIPQAGTLGLQGVEALVNAEAALLDQLKSDPEFMHAAQQRPPLQTFKFHVTGADAGPQAAHALIVREIPARLAIFRGCVGGDCSTSHSWAFPYSPFERYYFIENRAGQLIGYISAAITIVDGRPNFYLRDAVGPLAGLRPNDLKTIVYGFYLALEHLGVDQMTIMPSEFAHENVYPEQERVLRDIPTAGEVEQTFQDVNIRRKYLYSYVNESSYDRPERHARARALMPSKEILRNYQVELLGGESIAKRDTDPVARYWELIDGAALSNDPMILARNVDKQKDWQRLLSELRNERQAPLEKFYAAAIAASKEFGFPLSQNLIKKHDVMLRVGHLNAPDAFSTKDPKHLRQSMRYVRALLWDDRTAHEAIEFISARPDLMEAHEVMRGAFVSLFERRREEDAERIQTLWSAGIRFHDLVLSEEQLSWAIANVRLPDALFLFVGKQRALAGGRLPVGTLRAVSEMLENSDEGVPEEVSETAAAILYEDDISDASVLREIEESILGEDNPKIAVPLSLAYLRLDVKDDEIGSTAAKLIAAESKNKELPTKWRQEAARLLKQPEIARLRKLKSTEDSDDCTDKLTHRRVPGGT